MSKLIDSGIEWIGLMPENWATTAIGHHASVVKCKNTGMAETNLLSLSYGKIIRKNINSTEGLLPDNYEGYNIIESDDIVLRFTDLQNDHTSLRVGHAAERGIITSAYVTIRPHIKEDSKFLYFALHAFDLRKGFYGMGSGVRQGLNWQEAKYIRIPWPPESERKVIVEYLEHQFYLADRAMCLAAGKIGVVIQGKESIADCLRAFKQSLAYEVVTGKKRVV